MNLKDKRVYVLLMLTLFVCATAVYLSLTQKPEDVGLETVTPNDNHHSVDSNETLELASTMLAGTDATPTTQPVNADEASEKPSVALRKAKNQREKAEEALRVVELKVDALEAQLDDMELAGKDPADSEDQTIAAFHEIFAEYQDAIRAYEAAIEQERLLQDKIDGATTN